MPEIIRPVSLRDIRGHDEFMTALGTDTAKVRAELSSMFIDKVKKLFDDYPKLANGDRFRVVTISKKLIVMTRTGDGLEIDVRGGTCKGTYGVYSKCVRDGENKEISALQAYKVYNIIAQAYPVKCV